MTLPPSRTRSIRKVAPATATESAAVDANPPSEDRQALIAQTAFFLAESRGFSPGQEFDDWLLAERLVEQQRPAGRS
jgi:hypothetical protein